MALVRVTSLSPPLYGHEVRYLDCNKDAEEWDSCVAFGNPHFSSAYYRAWDKGGTLAVGHGCLKPFIYQDDDYIGNAYNFGGVVLADFANCRAFFDEFADWRAKEGVHERTTPDPFYSGGGPSSTKEAFIVQEPSAQNPPVTKMVVWIDLKQPFEFSDSVKYCLKRADKLGVKTEIVEPTVGNVSLFELIYNTAMESKQAKGHWRYPQGFFYRVLNELGPKRSAMFFTRVNGEVECGCIVLFGDGICYYQWAARIGANPKAGADHKQIFTVASWAKWRGMYGLHLGGGVEPNDNLYKFKLGFSPKTLYCYSYRTPSGAGHSDDYDKSWY